jgi:hypothetical protein
MYIGIIKIWTVVIWPLTRRYIIYKQGRLLLYLLFKHYAKSAYGGGCGVLCPRGESTIPGTHFIRDCAGTRKILTLRTLIPHVEVDYNTSTVVPASPMRRQRGNTVSDETTINVYWSSVT